MAASLLAVAAAAAPAEAAATDLSAQDRAFVDAAGHGGAFEVAAGVLAGDRASDPALRAFGRRMVTDHSKAGDKLTALADSLGISVPGSPDSVQRAILSQWSSLAGAAFDCSYAPMMYADHVADVGLFEREAADGQNSKLRAFARDTLPALREHRATAATNVKNLTCGTGNDNGTGPIGQPSPPWPIPWPVPTTRPTHHPTAHPTMWPTGRPSHRPTVTPTGTPTARPTTRPTVLPTWLPTRLPLPTLWPTRRPTPAASPTTAPVP
ncbi:DUF4142 domain-containing protein [Dactylosporangium sp. CA-139066]|uniref:DUF4142 domain-containing protein n=1 Tax=Dactylosporangium sp. CA-139066 TaxID=3239930 RepID=UPI003D94750A